MSASRLQANRIPGQVTKDWEYSSFLRKNSLHRSKKVVFLNVIIPKPEEATEESGLSGSSRSLGTCVGDVR